MGVQKLCELSLLDSDMSQFAPHSIGFACWSLARARFGFEPWSNLLAAETRCTVYDIEYAAHTIVALKQVLELSPTPCSLYEKITFVACTKGQAATTKQQTLFLPHRSIDGRNAALRDAAEGTQEAGTSM